MFGKKTSSSPPGKAPASQRPDGPAVKDQSKKTESTEGGEGKSRPNVTAEQMEQLQALSSLDSAPKESSSPKKAKPLGDDILSLEPVPKAEQPAPSPQDNMTS